MANDELTMLSFVGIYFLLLGGFIYNFYLSKKIYRLFDEMVEVMSIVADLKKPAKEGAMNRLIKEGMEIDPRLEKREME
jgi:hypothetical protein